jgi:hypothetical protein
MLDAENDLVSLCNVVFVQYAGTSDYSPILPYLDCLG